MAKTAPEVPAKLFYKIGEVCEITDTQPYVLRFWESEFPQLAPKKNRSGQRVYQKKDIETVVRIKQLLYEEEYTIAGARKKLDDEMSGGGDASAPAGRQGKGKRKAKKPRAAASEEEDHPVDLLATRTRRTAGSGGKGRSQDRARLEKALSEIKQTLREVLDILRDA